MVAVSWEAAVSEMVERVARAINETANKRLNAFFVDRNMAFALARAAIAAMREPTAAMEEAADNCSALMWSPEPGEGLDEVGWDVAWRAMIDEALAPSHN